MKTVKEYIRSLPSSSVNNSRQIVMSKLRAFHKFPSELRAREVEKITAEELQADFLDRDLGNEPETK